MPKRESVAAVKVGMHVEMRGVRSRAHLGLGSYVMTLQQAPTCPEMVHGG